MMLDGTSSPAVAGAPLADKPAVAVLPFENMSGDPEQVYFSDGITEDIITELSRFRDLMVIARNSSFSFRGKSTDVREIGRALGAGYVVEGSVRRAGGRVRITAQLVDAATGAHLWVERYDRSLGGRVRGPGGDRPEHRGNGGPADHPGQRGGGPAASAGGHPRLRPLSSGQPPLRRVHTGSSGASAGALRTGAPDRSRLRPCSYGTCLDLSQPRSRRAASGCRGSRTRTGSWRCARRKRHWRRIQNDPRVHSTLGYMCLIWRDFDRAERHMDLARTMNPNDPLIQIFWAWIQACVGKPERALPAAEIAVRLNPCHPGWYNYYLAHILFRLGRYQEAADLLERLTVSPGLHPRYMACVRRLVRTWGASRRRSAAPASSRVGPQPLARRPGCGSKGVCRLARGRPVPAAGRGRGTAARRSTTCRIAGMTP